MQQGVFTRAYAMFISANARSKNNCRLLDRKVDQPPKITPIIQSEIEAETTHTTNENEKISLPNLNNKIRKKAFQGPKG